MLPLRDPGFSWLGDFINSGLARYFFVGGVAAVVDWSVFWLFAIGLGYDYLLVASVGFMVATLVNYLLSLKFVFVSGRHKKHVEVFLVYLVSAFGLLLNIGILFMLVTLLAVHPMLAKVMATAAVFVWNFGARRLWVFEAAR